VLENYVTAARDKAVMSELAGPAHGFVAGIDSAFDQQFLNAAELRCEA